MHKFITILLFLIPSIAFGCPDLGGDWKSSKELTMKFTKQWTRIEDRSKELISQISGTASVQYSKDKVTFSDIPLRKITIQGKEMEWNGINESVKYDLLACTENTIAIKYRLFDKDFISILNFENEDTYWEYGGSPDLTENAHTRYYFVREKTLNKVKNLHSLRSFGRAENARPF